MKRSTWVVSTVLVTALVGCTNVPKPEVQKFKDGELSVPANYKSSAEVFIGYTAAGYQASP